jgi:hypothetical protein
MKINKILIVALLFIFTVAISLIGSIKKNKIEKFDDNNSHIDSIPINQSSDINTIAATASTLALRFTGIAATDISASAMMSTLISATAILINVDPLTLTINTIASAPQGGSVDVMFSIATPTVTDFSPQVAGPGLNTFIITLQNAGLTALTAVSITPINTQSVVAVAGTPSGAIAPYTFTIALTGVTTLDVNPILPTIINVLADAFSVPSASISVVNISDYETGTALIISIMSTSEVKLPVSSLYKPLQQAGLTSLKAVGIVQGNVDQSKNNQAAPYISIHAGSKKLSNALNAAQNNNDFIEIGKRAYAESLPNAYINLYNAVKKMLTARNKDPNGKLSCDSNLSASINQVMCLIMKGYTMAVSRANQTSLPIINCDCIV